MSITFGSLFAGIGGFDLGFERAGMRCKWQVEIDSYCQRVLAKHWPDVRRWDDVRTFPPEPFDDWRVDVICGGFPCQDISQANVVFRAGLSGGRSGLWREFLRIIVEIRPRAVAVENSWQQWRKWVPRVRRELWEIGYGSLPVGCDSSVFGTKHRRQRAFVVAHSDSDSQSVFTKYAETSCLPTNARRYRQDVWNTTPEFMGVANGIPNRVDRLKCCGNAVVPQVAEWIGRGIVVATPGGAE